MNFAPYSSFRALQEQSGREIQQPPAVGRELITIDLVGVPASSASSSRAARVTQPSSPAPHSDDTAATTTTAQVGSLVGTQGSAESATSANDAANNNGTSGTARRRSQAERNYYMFVEPEDQLASVFQLCVRDALHVLIVLSVVVFACVCAAGTSLVLYREDLQDHSYTVIAMFMVLTLQAVVLWRWATLMRIQRFEYNPSEDQLKSMGLLRALSVWVWVMSAMVAGGGSNIDRVFLGIFLVHFIAVDFFFVLARTVLVVGFLVVMPIYLPIAACRRRGATKRALSRIPVLRFNRAKFMAEDYNLDCPICLTDFEEGEPLRKLRCRHFFHKACVDRWLAHKSTCPVCRSDIKSGVDTHGAAAAADADMMDADGDADGDTGSDIEAGSVQRRRGGDDAGAAAEARAEVVVVDSAEAARALALRQAASSSGVVIAQAVPVAATVSMV